MKPESEAPGYCSECRTADPQLQADRRSAATSLRDVAAEIEAELRFRAATVNEIGQIVPPYTAHSLLSMADLLREALEDGSDESWERAREY